jgi:heme/copper-type cytochrome/quinol oxidase subunit 3
MASSGEKLPLGRMVPPVPLGTEIPPEPPDVGARGLAEAARLLSGASVFFFLAFVFSYFYLRSLNVEHMWHPRHVNPDQALGGAMIGCVVASAALAVLGGRQLKRRSRGWIGPVVVAVLLGLAAVALQCVEYTVQDFGPTNGAYASVFCIWTALYLFAVLGTMYWLETQLAAELRARRAPAARAEGDIAEADRLIAPGLDAAAFYWAFLAAIGVLTYVVLYLL